VRNRQPSGQAELRADPLWKLEQLITLLVAEL